MSTSMRRGPDWPKAWRDYLQFIRKPVLPFTTRSFGSDAVREVGSLLALNLILMVIFIVCLVAAAGMGVHLPNNKMDLSSLPIRIFAILFAPPIEEIMLRAWLPGRRRLLIVSAAFVALFVLLAVSHRLLLDRGSIGLILTVWALVTGFELYRSWGDDRVPAAYRSSFPIAFWASCTIFALLHVSNYESPTPFVLIMVVPQFVMGTILGFARMRYGMWANITIHSLSNAAVVALTFLG